MRLSIGDNNFKVKVAISPKSIKKGMMGQRFNDDFNGLLFLMGNDKSHCFWMYNCITPLDIIMIKDDIITKIHHNCLPCENESDCDSYCGNGDKVLEILGGTCKKQNIKEGDVISFSTSSI